MSEASDPIRRDGFRRVLLKLGGEMFGGGEVGLDPDVVGTVADQIADVVNSGVQVAVVIGGGNFFRGAELQQRGLDRSRSDYMGMLGTVCLRRSTSTRAARMRGRTGRTNSIAPGRSSRRRCAADLARGGFPRRARRVSRVGSGDDVR